MFRDAQQAGEAGTCIMDNQDQERERGITILAKNLAVARMVDGKKYKINIMVCALFSTNNCSWEARSNSILIFNTHIMLCFVLFFAGHTRSCR